VFRGARSATLALLLCVGCGILYTDSPRFGFGRRPREPRPPAVARPAHPVAGRRGSLPWPASGPVVREFGAITDPKYRTTVKSTGIDIAVTRGAPVTAVDSGVVSYADQFMGYGRMVILDHGGRFHSVYSRLLEIAVVVGEQVNRGQRIGLASDTLHFEFRAGGQTEDPRRWLAPR
jgi:septal ring factor EnvC (AmiA/AmiB activator)